MKIFSKKRISLLIFALLLSAGGIFYFTQTSQGATRTWTGAVDNNWSNASNWSGGKPGSGDVAYFDNTCTRCDVTINENVNVAGINMASNYTGTITQSGSYTITVGVSGWVQAGGTFVGGSGDISTYIFTLSDGTFTSTTGTLTIGIGSTVNTTILIFSGGTFNHNNGTIKFTSSVGGCGGPTVTVNTATSITLYNVNVHLGSGGCSGYPPDISTTGAGSITVRNQFTHTQGILGDGVWNIEGDVFIMPDADAGLGQLVFNGSGDQYYTYTSGTGGSYFKIQKTSGTVFPAAGTSDLYIDYFFLANGTFVAPPGTMEIGFWLGSESTTFFTKSGGTFEHNNGMLSFKVIGPYDYASGIMNITDPLSLYAVEIDLLNIGPMVLSGTVTVQGNFSHKNGVLNGGTWSIQGDVVVQSSANGGSATLEFTGPNNQTYTDQGGNEPDGDITINKTGGTVTLASNADWNASNQDLTITAGKLSSKGAYSIATNALTIGTAGEFIMAGTGDLTLGGTLTNSGKLFMASNGSCGGTDSIAIRSSVDTTKRSWNGTGRYTLQDLDVKDMGGTSALTLYSSTNTGNNSANWTFSGASCPVPSPALQVTTGSLRVSGGSVRFPGL